MFKPNELVFVVNFNDIFLISSSSGWASVSCSAIGHPSTLAEIFKKALKVK
jgi:hypothetical protein